MHYGTVAEAQLDHYLKSVDTALLTCVDTQGQLECCGQAQLEVSG